MKGTTKVIKLKNMRGPPESFETECMATSAPKEGEDFQGNIIMGGWCHRSATPTRTMCTVVPEAVFTRATFRAAFWSTRFSADSANAIYEHVESFTYENI